MTWFNTAYGYKKKITLNSAQVDGDEVDFPIYIGVTDGDLADTANGGHVESANGYDIIFTNSAEDTQLSHEIERYTNTTGELVFFVKVPSLSSGPADTEIYIYYGNDEIFADQSTTDTWDSHFLGVYHLDENAGNCIDSTANGNDGTFNGNLPNRTTGKMGYGQEFVAEDGDYISFPAGDMIGLSGTIELLVYTDAGDVRTRLWHFKQDADDYSQAAIYADVAPDRMNFLGKITGVNQWDIYEDATILEQWQYHGNAYQTNDAICIIDDDIIGTDNTVTPADWDYGSIELNGDVDGTRSDFYGDEFRISDNRRSTNWMSTTYETEFNPDTFLTFGAEEGYTVPESIYCQNFTLTGSSCTVTLSKPIPLGENNMITKNLNKFEFWSGSRSVHDEGIDGQPLILTGIETATTENYITIGDKFIDLNDMADNFEEIVIDGLGDGIDGTYVLKSVRTSTIKGIPYALKWILTLEKA